MVTIIRNHFLGLHCLFSPVCPNNLAKYSKFLEHRPVFHANYLLKWVLTFHKGVSFMNVRPCFQENIIQLSKKYLLSADFDQSSKV